MALTSFIRRAASQLVPLAARVVRRSQNYEHSALSSAVLNRCAGSRNLFRFSVPSMQLHDYSTRSDDSLLKVIQSEIECAEEPGEDSEVVEAPESYPFKIEDHPGQQTISLSRKYQDETIIVEVHMPSVDGIDGEDGSENDDTEKPAHFHLPLVVRVSKKRDGSCLEFGCTCRPDEVVIDHCTVKKPDAIDEQTAYGPEFLDLDENLQKALYKYLNTRGIKPDTTNFLFEYMINKDMINKDMREYLMWLKNVKKFIEA